MSVIARIRYGMTRIQKEPPVRMAYHGVRETVMADEDQVG